ncbi:hypothetical protein GCM10008969_37400 [Pseudomonas veronii subsp. inensis]|uniref:hypothetical protein n=1 Tax=Pseudomonas veronii TaxID=76761 RepID=UPI0031FA331E
MNIHSVKRCVLTGLILMVTGGALPAHAAPHGGGHGGGPGWWGIGLGLGLGWEAARIANPYYYPAYPVYLWVSGSFGTGEDLVGRSWIKQDNS